MSSERKEPDIYYGFEWPRFQASTHGWRPEWKWSYWTCCCAYYWNKCVGLLNIDEVLRTTAESPVHDWKIIKPLLFGPGSKFVLEADGRWHHEWTRQRYAQDKARIESAKEKGVKGSKARWSKQCPSNAQAHAQALPNSMPEQCPVPVPVPIDKQPTIGPKLLDVKEWAKIEGIPDQEAERFWNHFEASGWVDKNGNPIRNARAKLRIWSVDARAKPVEAAHHSSNGDRPAADPFWKNTKQLEQVDGELKAIESRASHTATGMIIEEKDREKYRTLKGKRKELKQALGL